jgi:hypothetical protein
MSFPLSQATDQRILAALKRDSLLGAEILKSPEPDEEEKQRSRGFGGAIRARYHLCDCARVRKTKRLNRWSVAAALGGIGWSCLSNAR